MLLSGRRSNKPPTVINSAIMVFASFHLCVRLLIRFTQFERSVSTQRTTAGSCAVLFIVV